MKVAKVAAKAVTLGAVAKSAAKIGAVAKVAGATTKGATAKAVAKTVVVGAVTAKASIAALCFPATAMVNLHNGKSVKMNDIQVGDKIHSGTTSFLLLIQPMFMRYIST